MRSITLLAVLITSGALTSRSAAPPNYGIPATVHYIEHDKVSAMFLKGGPLVSDPGLTVNASHKGTAAIEYHNKTSHIFYILSGEATFVVGGTLVDPKPTASGTGMTASAIDGGESYHVTKGDVILIPERTPHWWKEVPTGTVDYYAVDISTQ